MDSLLTILIWLGSGFAFAVGFIVGMCIMGRAMSNEKKNNDLAAEVNALLRERNAIGERQAAALEQIATAPNVKLS